MIAIVGTPDIIEAARAMDEVFWQSEPLLEAESGINEQKWAEFVRALESSHLGFVNLVRKEIVGISGRLDSLPIARPPMPRDSRPKPSNP
jgi:hypothetical protein